VPADVSTWQSYRRRGLGGELRMHPRKMRESLCPL
jgi:hypothetical protein